MVPAPQNDLRLPKSKPRCFLSLSTGIKDTELLWASPTSWFFGAVAQRDNPGSSSSTGLPAHPIAWLEPLRAWEHFLAVVLVSGAYSGRYFSVWHQSSADNHLTLELRLPLPCAWLCNMALARRSPQGWPAARNAPEAAAALQQQPAQAGAAVPGHEGHLEWSLSGDIAVVARAGPGRSGALASPTAPSIHIYIQ